ncbi:MAG: nitrous oxide reductase accessory protein NosL [Paracoccus sp. (in: a-proteobacteria)]
MKIRLDLLLALGLLAACRDEQAAAPEPVAMTAEAVGFYCQMNLLEHPGPKAQIHLKDGIAPLFFSQVRDAIAYQRMPEQAAEIAAIYVSDMADASWDDPGAENWMALPDALLVIDSNRAGGMGAPEIVPFSDEAAAQAYMAEYGGRLVRLDQIADADVLSAADKPNDHGAAEEGDYAARLRALAIPSEE